MATPPQLLQLAFAAGIDQSQRDEVLDPSTGFLTIENCRQGKRGGFYKRNGFTAMARTRLRGTSISALYKVLRHDQQPCMIDGSYLYAYSNTAARWEYRDPVPPCSALRKGAPYPGAQPVYSDVLYCNGYIVLAHIVATTTSAYSLACTVLDGSTYAVLRHETIVGSLPANNLARLGAVTDSSVVLVFYMSAANTASCRSIDLSSAANIYTGWSSATSVATDVTSASPVAADVATMTNRVAFFYCNTGGGTTRMTLKTISSARATLESRTITTAASNPTSASCAGSIADILWLAWDESQNGRVMGVDADDINTALATVATICTVASGTLTIVGIAPLTTGGMLAVSGGSGTNYQYSFREFGASGGATVAGGTGQVTWYFLQGRSQPWYNAATASYYASVVWTDPQSFTAGGFSNPDNVSHVVRLYQTTLSRPAEVVANFQSGVSLTRALSWGLPERGSHVAAISSTKYAILAPVLAAINTGNTNLGITVDGGVELVELDFASTTRWHPNQVGRTTVLTGGVTSVFDGQSLFEPGFFVRPGKPTEDHSGGSTLTTTNGGYRYIAVYEHIDATGAVHVSGVSSPSTATGNFAGKDVVVTVQNLFLTNRYGDFNPTTSADATFTRIAIYRTKDGETTYYRLATLANSTSAATQTYTDVTSDGNLGSAAKLYRPTGGSQPGEAQDHRVMPASRAAAVVNGVLVIVADDGLTLWESSEPTAADGIWCTPIHQLPIFDGGEIFALGSIDGTLYVFKRRSIFAVSVDPYPANASGGGFGIPRRLACEVGCTNQRSVVATSLGLFFQSERGIELLTRSQTVEWIGEAVQDVLSTYPVITAATLDSTNALVYFECAAAESSNQVSGNGVALVYDLTLKTWVSVDKRASGGGSATAPGQSAAMVWNGSTYKYAWGDTGGYVNVEGSDYLDQGSTWITVLVETGWFKMSGIQGYQHLNKVLLLGKKATRSDISIALAYDYSATYETAATKVANDVDTLSTALDRVQLEHPLHDEAGGQALRVKLYDATPTGGTVSTGQGVTWIALTIEGTPKPGAVRLPDTSR